MLMFLCVMFLCGGLPAWCCGMVILVARVGVLQVLHLPGQRLIPRVRSINLHLLKLHRLEAQINVYRTTSAVRMYLTVLLRKHLHPVHDHFEDKLQHCQSGHRGCWEVTDRPAALPLSQLQLVPGAHHQSRPVEPHVLLPANIHDHQQSRVWLRLCEKANMHIKQGICLNNLFFFPSISLSALTPYPCIWTNLSSFRFLTNPKNLWTLNFQLR